MNDPVLGRRYLREVLFMVPKGRRLSEPVLKAKLERLLGHRVTVPEFEAWLAWNVKEGFIESAWNKDTEETEWELTEKGREKEAGKR